MNSQRIRPSRWYYGLAVLVAIAGTSIFVLFLVKTLSGLGEDYIRVIVPGSSDITLSETGNYTIFYEHKSVIDGKVFSTSENLSGLYCALTDKKTGEEIKLSPAKSNSTYSTGGRSGTSVLEFRLDTPGTYEFTGWYDEEKEEPKVVMAIGRGFMMKLFGTIFGGIALLFGSWVVAIAITIVTFIKRYKASKSTPVN